MEILLFLFIIVFFSCTFIGFIQVMVWLGRAFQSGDQPNHASQQPPIQQNQAAVGPADKPTLEGDVEAAHRLIDYLYSVGQIDLNDHHRINEYLNRRVASEGKETFPQLSISPQPSPEQTTSTQSTPDPTQAQPPQSQLIPNVEIVFVDDQTTTPPSTTESTVSDQIVATTTSEPIAIPSTDMGTADSGDAIPVAALGSDAMAATPGTIDAEPAPWDLPDPPTATPRRSFKEVLSSFMEERNMRWGELTSGVLIVLSAVGLVVSLRDQLTDRIPYFSALLFLMITAAIHGAGIYTLKQWRLKNTSRGTLIIGLLLIPINFFAACLLNGDPSERAELSDPWYWAAITIGMLAFGLLTYWSSKLLFKKGIWPMILGVLGSGAATLVINRTITSESGTLASMLWAIPVLAFFLVGSTLVAKGPWTAKTYTGRSAVRLYLFLAIAVFGAANAIALVAARSASMIHGIVLMLPTIAVIGVVTSWIGLLTQSSHDEPVAADAPENDAAQLRAEKKLLALSLQILGYVVAVGAVIASASNPIVLVVTAVAAALVLFAIVIASRQPGLLPLPWLLTVVAALVVLLQSNGQLPLDDWMTLSSFRKATFNGTTALFLLGAAITTGALTLGANNRLSFLSADRSFLRNGLAAGSLLLLLGSTIAVSSSFLHRDQPFEVTVASVLLGVTSLASCAGTFFLAQKTRTIAAKLSAEQVVDDSELQLLDSIKQYSIGSWVPHLSLFITSVTAAHVSIWDFRVADWIRTTVGASDENYLDWMPWILSAQVVGLVAAITARSSVPSWDNAAIEDPDLEDESALARTILLCDKALPAARAIGAASLYWAVMMLTIAVVAALLLIMPAGTYWATAIVATCGIGWFLMGRTTYLTNQNQQPTVVPNRIDLRAWSMLPFLVVLTSAVFALTTESGLRFEWFERLFDTCHMFVIAITLAMVAFGFILTRGLSHVSKRKNWLTQTLALDRAWILISTVFVGVMLWDQSLRGMANEIFGDQTWANNAIAGSLFRDFDAVGPVLLWFAVGILAVTYLAGWFERPSRWFGFGLIAIWFTGWSFGATSFEASRSVATGNRWLVPISGAILAVIISLRSFIAAGWSKTRTLLNQPGRSALPATQTQQLVNFVLLIATFVVLTVSTVTTAQVLLNSPAALGGPLSDSIFKKISIEANFGAPVTIVVGTFLFLAITERRRWLATMGSGVFQFVVVMSLYFLTTSPHEKLASRWFVGILQTVSIGMTCYGLIWFYFRRRVNAQRVTSADLIESRSHLQVHTLVNGSLITGMAGVVLVKTFLNPAASVGWINSFGSWMGMGALIGYIVLVALVWRKELLSLRSPTVWSSLIGWAGVVSLGLIVALVDRGSQEAFQAWVTHRIATIGMLIVGLMQIGCVAWTQTRKAEPESTSTWLDQLRTIGTIAVVGSFGIFAAIHGMSASPTWFWVYAVLVATWSLISLSAGLYGRSSLFGFVASGIAATGYFWLCRIDPKNWFDEPVLSWFNLTVFTSAVMATIWSAYIVYLHLTRVEPDAATSDESPEDGIGTFPTAISFNPLHTFSLYPNVTMVAGVLWTVLMSFATISLFRDNSYWPIIHPLGLSMVASVLLLAVVNIFSNPLGKPRVFPFAAMTVSLGLIVVSSFGGSPGPGLTWYAFATSIVVMLWGVIWVARGSLMKIANHPKWDWLKSVEQGYEARLPIYTAALAVLMLFVISQMLIVWDIDDRVQRYALAAVPLFFAVSFGLQSNPNRGRWMQLTTLTAVTIAGISISFAEMMPNEMTATKQLVRAFIVLGGSMFIYGSLISRWVRHGDTWLTSLREATVGVCGCAVLLLAGVLFTEALRFVPEVGCGLSVVESVGVAVVILGMIIGLITIAVRPESDPFSLSLQGRTGYVYVAQLVAAAMVAHLYFSAPWLFQLGLRKYWPFVVMAICFVGVGISELLKKRNLTVLSLPLFNVASVLPVLVAVVSFVDSQQTGVALRPATIMMTVGMLYLMICYVRRTVVSGAACVVFGNAALLLLFHEYPAFAFIEHPQLWLIPPAASVLIASQLMQRQLSTQQLTAIRYLCASVIYISSTSEIFIRGIGDSLWPPILLAAFAVAGILAGMLMRIRSFLYFGSLFLLVAMLTMVSHAHQRFDHVWPWWAFGIGLGIAILIMFGMFEKKKNEMKQLAEQFRAWEE
ncbi:MAG: hypothetical protein AAFN77_08285 [Planctomycetota bacterium]